MEEKTYKSCEKLYIGDSDVAALTLVGCGDNGIKAEILKFGKDATYYAYLVEHGEKVGDHYHLVHSFKKWMSIYDDTERTMKFIADTINVYRAKEMGCIIELVNGGNDE